MNNRIALRFPLTKGEGCFPESSDFSAEEMADLKRCLSLNICWEPEEMADDDHQEAKILNVTVLYDGITPIDDEEYGYWFEDEELCGYPAPILLFTLDCRVDAEQFKACIYNTSYRLVTTKMLENDAEPFYAEDHNGYTSVLDDSELEDWVDFLQENKVFCGQSFDFPHGLPECGYVIPAVELYLSCSTGG